MIGIPFTRFLSRQQDSWPRSGALAMLLLFASQAAVTAPQSKSTPKAAATLIPASQTLSIGVPRQVAKGQITVVAAGRSWAKLRLSSQPLKLGNYVASIRFSKLDGANRAGLSDPRLKCQEGSPCPVDFEIVDAKTRGTYVGTVELDADGEQLATATINLLVPEAGPPPVLAGDFLKGNAVDFDATKDSSFVLSITNPTGSPSRSLKLTVASQEGDAANSAATCANSDIEFYPPSVLLDGGATEQIRVQVPSCLEKGTHNSILEITDSDDGWVVVSKAMKITKAASESSRRWALLFWVVFGATLSVALNNAFPLRRARADHFDELSRVKAKLNACGSIGSALRGSLRSEGQRLWLLIDSVSFVNTRKDAILAEAEQGIQALSQLVAVADSVNALRAECDGLSLPIRTLLVIGEYLRAAEDALLRSDVAGAQARVTAAALLAHTDCNPKALATALTSDIAKLLMERYNGNQPVPPIARDLKDCHACREEAIAQGRARPIAQRLVLLELNRTNLSEQPLPDLLTLERDFYIADVWTNVVEIAVSNSGDEVKERLKAMLPELLAQLEAAPVAAHTQLFISLAKSNLSSVDLQLALMGKHAKIDCNPYARYLDLENYQFRFLSPALSAVAATTQLLDYRWEFDDHTTPPDDGDRCKHFFWPPGRWKRIWRWISRESEPTHTVTVTVTMPLATKETYTFSQVIQMQRQKDRASSLGAIQIITFFITTGMAVLASFGAQYGGVLPVTVDWGVSVTALLFGFGIDQIRDRAASK